MSEEKPTNLDEVMSCKQFLESCPPGRLVIVTDIATRQGPRFLWSLAAPDLHLHCSTCDGVRVFSAEANLEDGYRFLQYRCRNCRLYSKMIAVNINRDAETTAKPQTMGGRAYKLGEAPPFGPPTPSRVITLIKDDLDLFLKGRRAEFQGMGIGAFAYYRRVVENQKNRLLDEIKRASLRVGVDPTVITLLDEARAEKQFSKAVALVKDAVPQALKIGEHNPLTLLHQALSKGLHDQTDKTCLAMANTIRVVLSDLAERLEKATRDDEELRKAVSRLHRKASEEGSQNDE